MVALAWIKRLFSGISPPRPEHFGFDMNIVAWNNSPPKGRIMMKFDILMF
jgi:hypothetical protein